MGKLSQKMTRDMAIRGLKESTQMLYLLAIRTLYEFYQTSPALLSDDHVQRFIYSLTERDLAWGTINAYVAGLRFFYGKTLKQDLERFIIPCPKKRKKLPQILSREEVRRVMVKEALALTEGSRSGAARLLKVTRQAVQQMLRSDDPSTGPTPPPKGPPS